MRKKANIKIGTLNINGLHTGTESGVSFEKWAEVNATMKKDKIAILAIQETHLDEPSLQAIHRAFGKRLRIINSQLENNPRASAGVTFALNKDLVETDNIRPSFLGNHYLLGHVTASQIGVEYRTLYILYETLSTHTQKKFK